MRSSSFGTWVAGAWAALQLLAGNAKAGLMKDASPAAYQAHVTMGLEMQGSVVHFLVDGTHQGSGVLIGDGYCVLMSRHQLTVAGVTDLTSKLLQISTSTNYFNLPAGDLVRIVGYVVHPNAPASGSAGPSDLIVAKLERIPAGAVPKQIATTAPAVGDTVKLYGFGTPAVPTGYLTATGDLLGGPAPVYELPTGYITTRFRMTSPEPLDFGGTLQDSGGIVVKADGTVAGSINGGTSPGLSQSTFSIDLAAPVNRNFIRQSLARFNPPQLSVELAAGGQQVRVIASGAPLVQEGGRWVIQVGAELQSLTTLPEANQTELNQNGFLIFPTDTGTGFFRLAFEPTL